MVKLLLNHAQNGLLKFVNVKLQNVAIAKLKEKGGVKKEDPNAVKKKLMSPEQKEKIRKRVAEDLGNLKRGLDKSRRCWYF